MSKSERPLSFEKYQAESRKTAIYPDKDSNFIYPTLGLSGEAGEVSEKIKKVLRDKGGVVDNETRRELSKELGDVLWYVANLATELGLDMEAIAQENLDKLSSRQERNRLHGSGDNR
ncbi:nucleoside triphosphate pyrophosphohydrolase family protein [Patescibacteria group bacterium]